MSQTIVQTLGSLALDAGSKGGQKPQKAQWHSETGKTDDEYEYKRYLPTFDPNEKYPPLEPFEHIEPGLKALDHADPRAFLRGAQVEDLTPDFGSEVHGVRLDLLDDVGRQQLSRFVAERGVVAFRNQKAFIDKDPEWLIKNWTTFFGRPHIHPVSGAPAGHPEFHLVYRDAKKTYNYDDWETRLTGTAWHSDVTYEAQPPGLTALYLFDSPPSGGDTGYVNQRAAYQRLSPSFRAYLETLQATHSGIEQVNYALSGGRGGIVRRDPVVNTHPVVRKHPITGEKALFVNRQFTRKIVGLKEEESDAILNLLYHHIELGSDFQIRVRWQPETVVLWDNRITAHTAIVDFAKTGYRRHGARLTPQAERPYI